jgi:hypothetical protein
MSAFLIFMLHAKNPAHHTGPGQLMDDKATKK